MGGDFPKLVTGVSSPLSGVEYAGSRKVPESRFIFPPKYVLYRNRQVDNQIRPAHLSRTGLPSAGRHFHSPPGILLAWAGFIYANALFNHGLIPSMEPRFAEVVREMLATGQYLVPIKNGIPYMEYPPLLYWLGVAGARLGLPIEAAIRLPCYLAFGAWIIYLDRLQRLLWKAWTPGVLALFGAALPAILWHFFTAQTDSLLITGVLIAFVGFAQLRCGPDHHRFPWRLWLGLILATAAKGPVGIACTLPPMMIEIGIAALLGRAPGAPFSPALWRFSRHLGTMCWYRGLALLIVTLVPWYLAAGMDRGWDFVRALVIYQNFDRYLLGHSHSQPAWYYLGSVLAGLFPFSLLIPFGFWAALKQARDFPTRLVLSWAVFSFVFFSLSASKQGKYLLPAAPALLALGIIGTEVFPGTNRERVFTWLKRWSIGVIGVWGVLVVAVLPFYSPRIAHQGQFSLIEEAISARPGELVQYGWPRSLTLYKLGAPMKYVRSSRELHEKIHSGAMKPGDYLLVAEPDLPLPGTRGRPGQMADLPAPPWFEHVLSVQAEKPMQLFRLLPGTQAMEPPPTPEPKKLDWVESQFDTD